jgi:hypothetical protein
MMSLKRLLSCATLAGIATTSIETVSASTAALRGLSESEASSAASSSASDDAAVAVANTTPAGPTTREEEGEEMNVHRSEWGINGSDMVNVDQHLGDLWEPFDNSKDTPFFLMIPKSGTSTFQDYLRRCTPDLNIASHLGGPYENDTVEQVVVDGHKYLNVNPSSREGLYHAGKVGIAHSAKKGVLISPYLHQVASIFNVIDQARWFTMIRNPLDRASSLFYYVQVNKHEAQYLPDSYKPWLKEWTIIEYVNSDLYTDNWMVRQIVGKSNKHEEITRVDLKNAKDIMGRKCLIGLMHRYEESLQRFSAYFGWTATEQCLDDLLNKNNENGGKRNANTHPKLVHQSEEWKAVVEKNLFDMDLYTHILELFDKQGELFFGDRAFPSKRTESM